MQLVKARSYFMIAFDVGNGLQLRRRGAARAQARQAYQFGGAVAAETIG